MIVELEYHCPATRQRCMMNGTKFCTVGVVPIITYCRSIGDGQNELCGVLDAGGCQCGRQWEPVYRHIEGSPGTNGPVLIPVTAESLDVDRFQLNIHNTCFSIQPEEAVSPPARTRPGTCPVVPQGRPGRPGWMRGDQCTRLLPSLPRREA